MLFIFYFSILYDYDESEPAVDKDEDGYHFGKSLSNVLDDKPYFAGYFFNFTPIILLHVYESYSMMLYYNMYLLGETTTKMPWKPWKKN